MWGGVRVGKKTEGNAWPNRRAFRSRAKKTKREEKREGGKKKALKKKGGGSGKGVGKSKQPTQKRMAAKGRKTTSNKPPRR